MGVNEHAYCSCKHSPWANEIPARMHLSSPRARLLGLVCCCKPVAQLNLGKILGIILPFGLSISPISHIYVIFLSCLLPTITEDLL